MSKRFIAPTTALLLCLALGSCASFSNAVSDHWPTWAGGMPKDVPPRPGAPGYEEFLAQQQGKNATSPAAAPAAGATAPAAPTASNANPAAAPSGQRLPNDQAAVQGGLY
jgi:hypothetical protein